MKSIMMTSLALGLLASIANANSLELNFNGNRIHDLSKYSETNETRLIKRDQLIAWNKPIAIFMDMPNIDETLKSGYIIRSMRPIKIGDRIIQCRATGQISDEDMARAPYEGSETERMMQFYKVQALRVESVKRTSISFSILDDGAPSNKRLICTSQTEKNGQPNNVNSEPPLKVEEIKEYITENNRTQLLEQYRTVEEVRIILEKYRKRQAEDQEAAKKLADAPKTELEKVFGRINPTKNRSAVLESLFRDSVRTHIVDAYRFPKTLTEIEPEEKAGSTQPAPTVPTKKSGAQAEGVGF